jgi:hypothetical protein
MKTLGRVLLMIIAPTLMLKIWFIYGMSPVAFVKSDRSISNILNS